MVRTALSQKQQYELFSANDFLGEKEFFSASQDQSLNIYFKTNTDILKFDGIDFTKVKLPIDAKKIQKLYAFKDFVLFSDKNKTYSYDSKSDSLIIIWESPAIQFQSFENQLWVLFKKQLNQIR